MTRGFALVEVVMALALFGFVGLAGGALLESAARDVREAESRERLLWTASSVLDSLRRRGRWSGGERTTADGLRVRWSPGEDGGVVELRVPGSDSLWLVAPVGAADPAGGES